MNHLFDAVPLGQSAVEEYYSPLGLTTVVIACGPRKFPMTAHVKALPNFALFFHLVDQAGLGNLVKEYNGCYVDRNKRRGGGKSMHALGAAFDINDHDNPMGEKPHMPAVLVSIARACGLFWGGDFHGIYQDGMHFQKGVEFTSLQELKGSGRIVPAVSYREGDLWDAREGKLVPKGQALLTPPSPPALAERHGVPLIVTPKSGTPVQVADAAALSPEGHWEVRLAALLQLPGCQLTADPKEAQAVEITAPSF